jgi:hypothetical protein
MRLLDLVRHKWVLQRNEQEGEPAHLAKVVARYPAQTKLWFPHVRLFSRIASGDGSTWLYCFENYRRGNAVGYDWDFVEQLSLEAFSDHPEWLADVTAQWNQFLPIGLSVRNRNRYYAIDDQGIFVTGCEPDFQPEVLGPSLDHLMTGLVHFA